MHTCTSGVEASDDEGGHSWEETAGHPIEVLLLLLQALESHASLRVVALQALRQNDDR